MEGEEFLTEKRIARLKDVVAHRQFDLTIVLENIHDPHNIGAVIRSCDAVGVAQIFVIITDPRVDIEKYQDVNNRISSGSRKWVKIHFYSDVDKAIDEIRNKYHYQHIMGTHMSSESVSLYDIDFKKSTAIVLGNEHEGISTQLLSHLDGNFLIPQLGMVQSLNISVACAVCLFEALRQRTKTTNEIQSEWGPQHDSLLQEYIKLSKPKLFDKE